MKIVPFFSCAMLVLFWGCGRNDPQSGLKEVSTPGSLNQENELLWQQGDKIFIGKCPALTEASRENCPAQVFRSSEVLSQEIDRQLREAITPVQREIGLETTKLREQHPRSQELRSLISQWQAQHASETSKRFSVRAEYDQVSKKLVQLDERISRKEGEEDQIQNEIAKNGSSKILEDLLNRIQKERRTLSAEREQNQQEQASLQRRLDDLDNSLADIDSNLASFQKELNVLLVTLPVSSSELAALQARLEVLQAQVDARPSVLNMIRAQPLVFRSLDFPPAEWAVLERLLTIMKSQSILPFREDFSGTVLNSTVWTLNKTLKTNINEVMNGRLRMDSNSGGVNEAILTLPLAGAKRVILEFEQYDLNDVETLLPERFQGTSAGDGVSISDDGQTWYTIVNALSLDTPQGQRFVITLDDKVAEIQKNYDPQFGLKTPFYFKFQQYEAQRIPDAREWDNITVASLAKADENVRLSLYGELEVKHNDQWRGVCDDQFTAVDGEVACRSLSGRYVSHQEGGKALMGYWIDELDCRGGESSLIACPQAPLGTHNCDTKENVILKCDFGA
jgi:hypothetical protein